MALQAFGIPEWIGKPLKNYTSLSISQLGRVTGTKSSTFYCYCTARHFFCNTQNSNSWRENSLNHRLQNWSGAWEKGHSAWHLRRSFIGHFGRLSSFSCLTVIKLERSVWAWRSDSAHFSLRLNSCNGSMTQANSTVNTDFFWGAATVCSQKDANFKCKGWLELAFVLSI